MPRNGSGTFNRLYSWEQDAANNIKIRADRMDAEMDGMATALSNSVAVDGQTPITANLPMSGFKHTGAAVATASGEYLTFGQSGSQVSYETLSDLQSANVPASVDLLYVQGHTTVGIGSAHYVRRGSDPGHPGTTQSADGAWWEISEEAPNVTMFGALFDESADDTQAWRDMFDYALYILQNVSGPEGGVKITAPAGQTNVSDELMSDAFQKAWWNQTDIRRRKWLHVEGAGAGSTIIQVTDNWVSGVRSTAHGNQRTYGPWSGQPSPSILFPTIADNSQGAPASFSMSGLRMVGSNRLGKDPIARVMASELLAKSSDIFIEKFKNSGELIMGSYNSSHNGIHVVGCGQQPVQIGSILGRPAGFFPSYVQFDGSGTTVSAKAAVAFDTFSVGDPVPFFQTAHVGKTFVVQQGADHNGEAQPLKLTIDSVASDGETSATVSFPSDGPSDWDGGSVSDKWGTFLPVEATTTASSSTVTLSDPVLIGSGAADMEGMIVMIPKAQSPSNTDNDVFCSRIISCDVGNDTDGYTELTLVHAPNAGVIDYFITSVGHGGVNEESIAASGNQSINDTDFIECQYEHLSGFADDITSSSFQFIISNHDGAVEFVACKTHGSTRRGQFGAEGQNIVDNCDGLSMVGFNSTHECLTGNGQIRFMGARNIVKLTSQGAGSGQLPHDYIAYYADPQSGFRLVNWGIEETGSIIRRNDEFPVFEQKLKGSTFSSNYATHSLFMDNKKRFREAVDLDDSDDLDDVVIPGLYAWSGDVPANTPGGTHGVMRVASNNNETGVANDLTYQTVYDGNDNVVYERIAFQGTFNSWRSVTTQLVAGGFANAGNGINQRGKAPGVTHLNTATGLLMTALGPASTDGWQPSDGSAVVTPS